MEKIIVVLNVGSSSVKFAVARNTTVLLHGVVGNFGRRAEVAVIKNNRTDTRVSNIPDLEAGLKAIQREIQKNNFHPTVVAHRIVHGGQRFSGPEQLTSSALHYLHSLIELAPLHQGANLLGVHFSRLAWPETTQWGVFDTALYRHLPTYVQTYALPQELTKHLHIEKYGFHGLSHEWAFAQALKKLRTQAKNTSAVTVHLGSGASMTLWDHGRPIDTTMGFTPLEGLVMSTRSGDIDPSIPLYIQKKLGWSVQQVTTMLEERSGLVGISGLKDMRDILSATGHPVSGWHHRTWSKTERAKAQLALDMYCYHIRRTLSGYLGLLDRAQAIIFTGPIGGNALMQKIILKNLPAARGKRYITIPDNEQQAIVDAISA